MNPDTTTGLDGLVPTEERLVRALEELAASISKLANRPDYFAIHKARRTGEGGEWHVADNATIVSRKSIIAVEHPDLGQPWFVALDMKDSPWGGSATFKMTPEQYFDLTGLALQRAEPVSQS